MTDLVSTPPSASGRVLHAARVLERLADAARPGERLGTKLELRARCDVSVGTFNEAVTLAQSRGYLTSRSGPGGGLFAAERSPIVRLGSSVLALDGGATSVAEAVRMRDALDPLLVEDALWHSSATHLAAMRSCLREMAAARDTGESVAFVRANWALHRSIAESSPSTILRSVYLSLLDLIENHALAVGGTAEKPLPDYIAARYRLHEELVDAIETRDQPLAQKLITQHNNTALVES